MQARHPLPAPRRPRRPLQHPPRRRPARRLPWGQIGEAGAQLSAGILAIVVATVALAGLVPHYRAQQERLQAIQAEVKRAEKRVEGLQARLQRNFDPQQAMAVMQEQTARIDPQLWPIVFLEQPPAELRDSRP